MTVDDPRRLIEYVVAWKKQSFQKVMDGVMNSHTCVRPWKYWSDSSRLCAAGLIDQDDYNRELQKVYDGEYPWEERKAWNDAAMSLLYWKLQGEMILREDKQTPRGRRPEVRREAKRRIDTALKDEEESRKKLERAKKRVRGYQ